jgi:hypothetical protein
MALAWLEESLDERTIVCEQQKSFGVGVEPSGGIDVLRKSKLGKRSLTRLIRRKLREDSKRLIEQDISRHSASTKSAVTK